MKYKTIIENQLKNYEFDKIIYLASEWEKYQNYMVYKGSNYMTEEEFGKLQEIAESGKVCFVSEIYTEENKLNYLLTFNNIKGIVDDKVDGFMSEFGVSVNELEGQIIVKVKMSEVF